MALRMAVDFNWMKFKLETAVEHSDWAISLRNQVRRPTLNETRTNSLDRLGSNANGKWNEKSNKSSTNWSKWNIKMPLEWKAINEQSQPEEVIEHQFDNYRNRATFDKWPSYEQNVRRRKDGASGVKPQTKTQTYRKDMRRSWRISTRTA